MTRDQCWKETEFQKNLKVGDFILLRSDYEDGREVYQIAAFGEKITEGRLVYLKCVSLKECPHCGRSPHPSQIKGILKLSTLWIEKYADLNASKDLLDLKPASD